MLAENPYKDFVSLRNLERHNFYLFELACKAQLKECINELREAMDARHRGTALTKLLDEWGKEVER